MKMIKRTLGAIAVAMSIITAVPAFQSCGDPDEEKEEEEPEPEPDPEPTPDPDPVDDDTWTGTYPTGIEVGNFTENFSDGKKCVGYYAIIDESKNSRLRFNANLSNPRKVPTVIFSGFDKATKGTPYIVTNGGYFAGGTSVSLCIVDSKVKAMSQRVVNWPSDENCTNQIYPVRSALGQMADGKFDIEWVYCTSTYSMTQTAFPSTMGNNEKTKTFNTEPPSPTAEGAFTWAPVMAVSGGPRLLKDGVDVSEESYWGECLDAGGTAGMSRQPRTAAGITKDNRLILLVCDGRGCRGSAGYTLKELAAKLASLGAVDALNFDGGGSSQIVGGDGKVMNWPSDGGTGSLVERKIVTSIVISQVKK